MNEMKGMKADGYTKLLPDMAASEKAKEIYIMAGISAFMKRA